MIAAPIPANEEQRLRALEELAILGTPAEERFDRVTRLCQRLFGVPHAFVNLVGRDRLFMKSGPGSEHRQEPRSTSFCGHTILHVEGMVVEDLEGDPRFTDNPLVIGDPRFRFQASAQPGCLEELYAVLDRLWAQSPDVEAPARMRFATAVSEVLGNVVVHGRTGEGAIPTVRVSLQAGPDGLRAELLDDGVALAPCAAARELPEDDLAETGRGLALARAALDELHYVRDVGANRWELVIRRPA